MSIFDRVFEMIRTLGLKILTVKKRKKFLGRSNLSFNFSHKGYDCVVLLMSRIITVRLLFIIKNCFDIVTPLSEL